MNSRIRLNEHVYTYSRLYLIMQLTQQYSRKDSESYNGALYFQVDSYGKKGPEKKIGVHELFFIPLIISHAHIDIVLYYIEDTYLFLVPWYSVKKTKTFCFSSAVRDHSTLEQSIKKYVCYPTGWISVDCR